MKLLVPTVRHFNETLIRNTGDPQEDLADLVADASSLVKMQNLGDFMERISTGNIPAMSRESGFHTFFQLVPSEGS